MEHPNPTRERFKGRKTSTPSRSIALRAVRNGVSSVAKLSSPVDFLSKLQSERGPVLGLRAAVLQMGVKIIVELNHGLVTHTITVVESSSKAAWAGGGLLVEPGMLKHNTRTFALASTLRIPELPPDVSLQSVRVFLAMGNVKDHELFVYTSLDSAKKITKSQDGCTVLATHDGTEGCTLSAALWEESLTFLYIHISHVTLWTSILSCSSSHFSNPSPKSGSLVLPTTEILVLAVSLRTFRRPLWEGVSQEFTREESFKCGSTIIFPQLTGGMDGFPQSRRLQNDPNLPFSYPNLNATGKFNTCVLLDCTVLPGAVVAYVENCAMLLASWLFSALALIATCTLAAVKC